ALNNSSLEVVLRFGLITRPRIFGTMAAMLIDKLILLIDSFNPWSWLKTAREVLLSAVPECGPLFGAPCLVGKRFPPRQTKAHLWNRFATQPARRERRAPWMPTRTNRMLTTKTGNPLYALYVSSGYRRPVRCFSAANCSINAARSASR